MNDSFLGLIWDSRNQDTGRGRGLEGHVWSPGEEHASSANKLQFAPQHRHLWQETVDVVDGQMKRFIMQPVLFANFH